MCMCVKKTDRSKKIVFVLSGGIYTSLCEGLNMEDEIRQLAAGVPPCPLRPLFTSQWAERNLCYLLCFSSRLREREGQHGLCLLLKKNRHTLIHTSSSYAHFLFLMRVPVAGCALALPVLSILTFCEHHTTAQIPTKHNLQTILLCK